MKVWTRVVSAVATLAVLLTCAPPAAAQFFGWRFSEFQPNIRNGGRASTIAVHPTNSDTMLVTAESGGLFRTTNGGGRWTHIDGMPQFQLNSVAYVPADPTIVILTANEDFRATNGGGIWRSTNGGFTWAQVTPGPPQPAGVTDRLTAWEISIAPDSGTIYVGHTYGLSISTDRGVTWTHSSPFGTGDRRVISVVAQRGNRVIVGGPAGIRRSPDAGVTWHAPVTGPGAIFDLHALGGSPLDPSTAYAVNGSTELWFTEDSGDHWTRIMGAPGGGGACGGIAFIKAIGFQINRPPPIPPFRTLRLWFGNRCGLSTLNATPVPATVRFTYGGSWTNRNMDHGDTRDLAFDPVRVPLLLATDGGLHSTADSGMNWTYTGGGNDGFNALQITEVKGQWITSLGRHDLYFGTQDNSLFASGDNGVSWINPVCCEGFFIEREHRVTTAADSKVTFVACGGCGNYITNPLFTGLAGWPDVTSPPAGNPKILTRNVYVQGVETGGAFTKGMARTADRGATWTQYANIPEDRRDLPKLSIPTTIRPVIYQSIRTGWHGAGGFEINTLARVVKNLLGTGATVGYPSNTNFGGLGINPTMFAWYQVFGVDPGDTRHVIAPDVVNEKMMETRDGGNTWTEIPGLTALITDGGTYLFRRRIFPFASAVSFSPDDPNKVAVGTWQNGVFVSADRGATWQKVPGSERATYVTSIEWKSGNEAIVSSYGRGLWKMSWGLIFRLPDFVVVCREPCLREPFPPFEDPQIRFGEAVLVFDGRVMGGRLADGVLEQLFVSPGSSVVFYSDTKKAASVKVTETAKEMGFGDAKAPKAPKQGMQLTGLQLAEDKPVLAVYSAKPLPVYALTAKERDAVDVEMRKESPTKGRPYVELNPSRGGTNSVGPGETIELVVRNLPRGTPLEIAIDEVTVEKGQANANGVLVMKVRAPRAFGLHSITLRDANRKTIDGAMFLVKPQDEREKR